MARIPLLRLQPGESPILIHGGDYNPDQWLDYPEILEEDTRLMKLAKLNSASVAIFAWVALEPEEGRFEFGWLDETIDRLHKAGITVILATPTGARPAWMSQKYPEVLRVAPNRVRNLHGYRHNHCFTSPVYREKTRIINTELAARYSQHPAVVLWHLSNEYNGECHCPLCQEAFRAWLRERYGDSLDDLNKAWWTSFWSHTYTAWEQIESPAPHGETRVHGLNLDWKRFVTHQTRDFMRHEIACLRAVDDSIPVTTNLMGFFEPLDYFKLAADLDVVSWDSYPLWHHDPAGDTHLAATVAMKHDLNRSFHRKPFLLMESVTSATNWVQMSKVKRPGMHLLSSLQAVAHGSDSVQYFQFRKSQGSCEKFHGAVVDHAGHENTRVFREVTEVGTALEQLAEVAGTTIPAQAAVIVDWENWWAIDDAMGPRADGRKAYVETCQRHHRALHRLSVLTDVIDSETDFGRYKIIAAPMLYMIKPGVAERLEEFVRSGGTLVVTYWSGIANESDLCFTGGFPGPLRELLGIWSEEIDALHKDDQLSVRVKWPEGEREYRAFELADLIHSEGAETIGIYQGQFYSGRPAVTVNRVGSGTAYYVASRNDQTFLADLYQRIVTTGKPRRAFDEILPEGVSATIREADGVQYRFVMNFTTKEVEVPGLATSEKLVYQSGTSGSEAMPATSLPPYGVQVRRGQSRP